MQTSGIFLKVQDVALSFGGVVQEMALIYYDISLYLQNSFISKMLIELTTSRKRFICRRWWNVTR